MTRLLLLLAALIAFSPAYSNAENMIGRWAAHAEGRAVTIIEIKKDGERLIANVTTPEKGYINQSHAAVDIGGPSKTKKLLELDRSESRVEFAPASDPDDVHVISLAQPGYLTLGHKAVPSFEPILFVPALIDEQISSDWSGKTDWMLSDRWPDNPEVTKLFEDDQKARLQKQPIDWKVVNKEDTERRSAIEKLLDGGKLRSGADFYHAAFIFQHGDQPIDFLKAHGLAVIAAAKGRRDATWIAAATLDRYLQNIERPQIYGTQYQMPDNQPVTQEPYDRSILSDALRKASGVPDIQAQEARRKEMEEAAAKRRSASKE